jgi:Ca-activated chloride channel family protein
MSFTSPLALLALLLIPLVVILHSLAVRWRRKEVSSLLFWSEVLRENRASMRIRRILRNLVLLAECLAIAAIAFAIAGPLFARRGGPGSDVIVVLDTTASMKAREGSRTRFDEARGRALEALSGLGRGSRMLVITAGCTPRLAVPFTDDREALRRAIQAAQATDEPGDLRNAVLLALSLRDAARGDRLLLITDGAFDSLGDIDPARPWMRWVRVGAARSNIGITSLAFRRTVGGAEAYEMFLSLRSFSPRQETFPLTVSAGSSVVVREQVTLAPGGARGISVPWTGPTSGRVTAEIGVSDDLAADDRAFAVFAPARGVSVRLVGEGNFFLETALSSLPNVTVGRVSAAEALAASGEEPAPGRGAPAGPDVTIFDGTVVPPLGKGAYIVIDSVPAGLPLRASGTRDGLRVTNANLTHPLLASVTLEGVAIGQALRLEPGPGFTELAAAGGTPVMLAWDQGELKLLLIGFDVRESDLPLRTAFPVLLANALGWFFPSWLSVQAEQLQAGTPVLLSSAAGRVVTITLPGGGIRSLAGTGEPVEFTETSTAGFYRVQGGGEQREIAVNLASPGESNIEPRFEVPAEGEPSANPVDKTRGARVPLWSSFALAAFLLAAVEWAAWLRETASVRQGARR